MYNIHLRKHIKLIRCQSYSIFQMHIAIENQMEKFYFNNIPDAKGDISLSNSEYLVSGHDHHQQLKMVIMFILV